MMKKYLPIFYVALLEGVAVGALGIAFINRHSASPARFWTLITIGCASFVIGAAIGAKQMPVATSETEKATFFRRHPFYTMLLATLIGTAVGVLCFYFLSRN